MDVPSETTQIMALSLPEGYAITPSEFVECFEQYDTTTPLPDQSMWEPWDDNPDAAEFYATHEQSHYGATALAIDNNDDAVHRFGGYTEDVWEFKAWQYIPEDMNDLQYFILLNTYPASESQHWSMQIECDGAQGLIRDFNGDEALPMVKGQWCEIKLVIDLDEDEQSVYYNDVPLVTKSWSAGVAPGGAINIAALDLWGNASSSEVYYDDISLTRSEGPPCPGDIDEDGDVDTADLLALLAAWGACP